MAGAWTRIVGGVRQLRPIGWLKSTGRAAKAVPSWLLGRSAESWIAVGTLIQAGIFGVAGYLTYQQWTGDKAMSFQERWTSPSMSVARSRLDDALLCRGLTLAASGSAGPELVPIANSGEQTYSDNQRYTRALETIYPSRDYVGLVDDFPKLNEFFSSLNTCVEAGVCDEETSCRFLGKNASVTAKSFHFHIIRQQVLLLDPTYGRNIAQLADRCSPYFADNRSLEKIRDEADGLKLVRQVLERRQPSITAPETAYFQNQQKAACERMKPEAVRAQNERAARLEAEAPTGE